MKLKGKIKEVVFECESEEQALELFQTYRKNNFHLVSKKVIDPKSNSMVIKLIRFPEEQPANNIDTVWENFVLQMRDVGFSNKYVTMVLENIKAKKEFWKTHPVDHLHNVIFDITRFSSPKDLSQRLCLIADRNSIPSFWCSLQKSLKYYIKERGFFVVAPEDILNNVKELRIANNIQVQTYKDADLSLQNLSLTLEGEAGIWFIPAEEAKSLGSDFINGVCSAFDMSLLLDSSLNLDQFKSFFEMPCGLVGEYRENYEGLFKTLEDSYFKQLPISFFWNGETLGEMQNPEKQTIEALENAFEAWDNNLATVA